MILETGMLLSSLTRARMAIVVKGHVELPSDLQGIIRFGYNDHVKEVVPKLCQRLKEAGFDLQPAVLTLLVYARCLEEAYLGWVLETVVGGRSTVRVWTHGWWHRNPLYKVAFNLGQIVVSIGVAGIVYEQLGGKVGPAFNPDQSQILPLLAAPLVYFFMNTGQISLAIGLKERISALRIWQTNFQWEILHVFFFLPFGILLALVHLRIGPDL